MFSALNEPFFDPSFRLARYEGAPFPPDERGIEQRAEEVSMEETGSPLWNDTARDALIERLMAGAQPQGEAEATGLGQPPFSNFVALRNQEPMGGTALPGQGPGEAEKARRMMQPPSQTPMVPETATPGTTGELTPTAPTTFPISPEAQPQVVRSQPMPTPGPMPTQGWQPSGAVNPFQGGNILDVLRSSIPAQLLIDLLQGQMPGTMPGAPGAPVPGGAPVPVPVGAMGMGGQMAAPTALADAVMQALGALPAAANDPRNRPVYGLTQAGPTPMGTQGGMADATAVIARLLDELIPGNQGFL